MVVKMVLLNIIGWNLVYILYNHIEIYSWIYGMQFWLVSLQWLHKRFHFEKYFWHRKSLLFWVKKLHFSLWCDTTWSYLDTSLKAKGSMVCRISLKMSFQSVKNFWHFIWKVLWVKKIHLSLSMYLY